MLRLELQVVAEHRRHLDPWAHGQPSIAATGRAQTLGLDSRAMSTWLAFDAGSPGHQRRRSRATGLSSARAPARAGRDPRCCTRSNPASAGPRSRCRELDGVRRAQRTRAASPASGSRSPPPSVSAPGSPCGSSRSRISPASRCRRSPQPSGGRRSPAEAASGARGRPARRMVRAGVRADLRTASRRRPDRSGCRPRRSARRRESFSPPMPPSPLPARLAGEPASIAPPRSRRRSRWPPLPDGSTAWCRQSSIRSTCGPSRPAAPGVNDPRRSAAGGMRRHRPLRSRCGSVALRPPISSAGRPRSGAPSTSPGAPTSSPASGRLRGRSRWLAETAGGRAVGFALFRPVADEAELLRIGTAPAWRRTAGRPAPSARPRRLERAGGRSATLEVRADNARRAGALPAARIRARRSRRRYYRDGLRRLALRSQSGQRGPREPPVEGAKGRRAILGCGPLSNAEKGDFDLCRISTP